MSPTQKAIAAVRKLDSRTTELRNHLAAAETAARRAQEEAAMLVGEPGFDAAVDRISQNTARVAAMGTALTKIEAERSTALLTIAAAHQSELTAEADRMEAEVRKIHSEARILLDKLASLMGVKIYPISILFGEAVAPVDLKTLDPSSLPMDFVRFRPKTAMMLDEATNLRRNAALIAAPADARRYAEARLQEVTA